MPKQTLMVFAHPKCIKSSKVSFQSLETEIEDLEPGLGKVADAMDSQKLTHGRIIPLWGYVHVSAEQTEDEDWDIDLNDDTSSKSQTTEAVSTEEDDEIPF